MPALSPQICLEVQKQDAEASVESPRPQLCASGGEWYLEGKVKTKQSSRERELCVISHEEPKAGVSSSGETAVKPYGETESGCIVAISGAPRGNHVSPQGQKRGPPVEITWAPRGNHVGPPSKSRGPPWKSRGPTGAITRATRGNIVGPQGKSRGPPGAITWATRGNHVGPQGQSRGPPGAITWAPRGNHVHMHQFSSVQLLSRV